MLVHRLMYRLCIDCAPESHTDGDLPIRLQPCRANMFTKSVNLKFVAEIELWTSRPRHYWYSPIPISVAIIPIRVGIMHNHGLSSLYKRSLSKYDISNIVCYMDLAVYNVLRCRTESHHEIPMYGVRIDFKGPQFYSTAIFY